MIRIEATEDTQSLTTFGANVAGFVDQGRERRRPLILTQHGRSAAVLLGAEDYEALKEELEVLRDIQIGLAAEGKTVLHDAVVAELRDIVRNQGTQ